MATYPFPEITPNESTWSLESNVGRFVSPLTGATQTVDRSGERWRVSLSFRNMQAAQRAQLQQFISLMNGGQHRVALRDFSYTPRGSITTTDLHAALTAASQSYDSGFLSLANITGGVRVVRFRNQVNASVIRPTTEAVTTAGTSYANRLATRAYADSQAVGVRHFISKSGSGDSSLYLGSSGNHATSVSVQGITAVDGGVRAGPTSDVDGLIRSQFDILENSLARCFLVDNGVNKILQSQTFDNGSWTKTLSSITADPSPYATLAPDGSQTADTFIEDSSTGTHLMLQSVSRASAAEYWTGSVYAKANTNERIRVIVGADGANNDSATAIFDLVGASISSAAAVTGNAVNPYATIHSIGNGWYRCRVSVKLPATTAAQLTLVHCDGASNTTSYTGDGSSSIFVWGAQLQKGGQLGRYVATTTAAATEDSQTGNAIWLKGLNASTNGQLLAGDLIEINGQLLQLTADLDGDASGVGLAEVQPRIRTAPSDEDAAVLYRPQGRFLLANVSNGWANRPGIFSDMTLEFIEDITV